MSERAKVCRFGRHRCRVVEKTEQPSPIETISDAGVLKMKGLSESWLRIGTRPVIVTLRCDDCGTETVRRV